MPIHSITRPSRTRSTRTHLPSLDQPIITQTNNNNDSQLQNLSYEEILRKSLGWRYTVGKKLTITDLLNMNTNKRKGWMAEAERKRKGQSIMASKKRTEAETNLLMVQYSIISGVAKESVGNNIITNFRYV